MSNGITITGRKKNIQYDFYETPTWATKKVLEALLNDNMIDRNSIIYEPCSGAGAIVNVLKEYNFNNIKMSDIQTGDFIVGDKGVDVYSLPDKCCEIVLTNPPYDRMTKDNMLNEFLRISTGKVILLLNIFYLSSKDRKEMLENSHLRHIYIHSDRVTMYPYGLPKPQNGGTKMFAWYVWDNEYKGKPTISWI